MSIPIRYKYGLIGIMAYETFGFVLLIVGFVLAATVVHDWGPLFIPALLLFSPVQIIMAGLTFLIGFIIGIFKEKKGN